jgi:hypothetical protein
MACSMTSAPPHNTDRPVENVWRAPTKHTTDLGLQRSAQAPPDLNSAVHSTAKDHKKSIRVPESSAENPLMKTDLGSCGLNFERHRLDIVI